MLDFVFTNQFKKDLKLIEGDWVILYELDEGKRISFVYTGNDIEGCRMWVSDKTIIKLARVLHVEAYQLLVPIRPAENPPIGVSNRSTLLFDLGDNRYMEQRKILCSLFFIIYILVFDIYLIMFQFCIYN
jgi:hypothetical protein